MKISVNIAANAAAIKLQQYIDYQQAVDDVERVHVITGKSSESIKLMQMQVLSDIIMRFEAAVNIASVGFERKVRVDAIELGFIPDLATMSFAEYVDIDSNASKLYVDNKLDGQVALKLMAILYRPIKSKFGTRYDIEKYDSDKVVKYIDSVKELTMDHVLNVLLFFSTLESELYNSSLEYLAREITEIVTEMTKP